MLTGMRVHPESARPFNKIEREAVFKLSDSCKYVIFRFCRASVFLLSLLLLLLFWGGPYLSLGSIYGVVLFICLFLPFAGSGTIARTTCRRSEDVQAGDAVYRTRGMFIGVRGCIMSIPDYQRATWHLSFVLLADEVDALYISLDGTLDVYMEGVGKV